MSIDLHIDELVLHGPVTNYFAVAAALEQTLAQSLRHCDPATLTAANVSDLGVLTVGIPPNSPADAFGRQIGLALSNAVSKT